MLVMGFSLRPGMPCEIDLHAQTGQRRKRFWFLRSIDWNGGTHTGALLENWYENKREFEAENPDHPITWVRAGLDSREWLIKVKFGEAKIAQKVGGAKSFPTDDWLFAACLVAAGYHLLKIESNRLWFFDDGKCGIQREQYLRPFNADDPVSRLPIIWRREGLRARDYLHTLIGSKAVIPMVHTQHKGHHVFLSALASRETKHQLFST